MHDLVYASDINSVSKSVTLKEDVSYITEYRLLMRISKLWNKDKNNVTYH